MRYTIAGALLAAIATAASAQVHVDGYYRSNGTYVAPHYRSSPDSSRLNNWSTEPNVNPYTGQQGTESPYPTYNSNTLRGLGGGNDFYGRMR